MFKISWHFVSICILICSFGTGHRVVKVVDFEYVDPTNQVRTTKQGIQITFSDSSRVIFRLSGTGSRCACSQDADSIECAYSFACFSGATVRLYIDSYVSDEALYEADAQVSALVSFRSVSCLIFACRMCCVRL